MTVNKPGTLLVVRKKVAVRKGDTLEPPMSGIHDVFEVDHSMYPDRPRVYGYIYLPYGTPVLLRELTAAPGTGFSRKNRTCIRLLYGEQYLVGHLSRDQIRKWFTFPDVWNKYYKNRVKTAT